MEQSFAPTICTFFASILSCLFSAVALSASEVSINGTNFEVMASPITIIQDERSNSVGIIDDGGVSDSAVKQTGSYNRTAIIQFGNDKLAILRQPGLFNRAMIVQVAGNQEDVQSIDAHQGTGTESVNYLFTLQTTVNDADPIARQFNSLTPREAKTVARNFIYAPEVSRINVGLLEDVSIHFSSLLENRLDQTRFGSCENRKLHGNFEYSAGTSIKSSPTCSSTPFFATLSYERADRDNALGALGYKQDIRSATVGADFPLGPMSKLGVALNVEKSDGDIREGLGSISTTGYQIGGFGSVSQSQYYLDLIATLGKVNFTSDRFSGPTKVRSDADGWSYTGRFQAGYLFGNDYFHVGPLLAARYSKGSVDSYWEEGNILMTQWISKQDREGFVASIGALLDRQDDIGRFLLHSYLKFELERDFGIGRHNDVESIFSLSPNATVFTPVNDISEDTYGRISAGINLSINKQARVSLAGTTLIGADKLDRRAVYGEVSVAF